MGLISNKWLDKFMFHNSLWQEIKSAIKRGRFRLIFVLFLVCSYSVLSQDNQNISAVKDHLQENNLENAREILQQELYENNTNDAEAWYLLGYIYARQRQYSKMTAAFARAADLSPEFKTEGVEVAEGSENKIHARDGVDFILQSLWGETFAGGIKYFNDALDAESEPAREVNLEQSVVFFRTAAMIIPDSALAHRNLAAALMKLGRYKQSIQSLEKALQLSPDDLEIRAMRDSLQAKIREHGPGTLPPKDRPPVITLFEPGGATLLPGGTWQIEVDSASSDTMVFRGIVTDDRDVVSLSIAGNAVKLTGSPKHREFALSRVVTIGGDSSSIEFQARDNRQNIAGYTYQITYASKEKFRPIKTRNIYPPPAVEDKNGIDKSLLIIFGVAVLVGIIYVIRHLKSIKKSIPDPQNIDEEEEIPRPLTTLEMEIIEGMGKTWAVLIANNAYTDWPDLNGEPYEDVAKVKEVLKLYRFDHIIEKWDLNKDEFELFLENIYQEIVREGVNSILIYYAGHGEYNQLLDRGYWIPVDAHMHKNRLGYLDDHTIKEYIKLYNRQAKHVLLISDCCFSGNLLKFRSGEMSSPPIPDIYNLRTDVSNRSATGITSGRKEERVANTSIFTRALIDLLIRNRKRYLRDEDIAYEVIQKVREVIKQQQPQFGPIADSHDFGKFVFIRKEIA